METGTLDKVSFHPETRFERHASLAIGFEAHMLKIIEDLSKVRYGAKKKDIEIEPRVKFYHKIYMKSLQHAI